LGLVKLQVGIPGAKVLIMQQPPPLCSNPPFEIAWATTGSGPELDGTTEEEGGALDEADEADEAKGVETETTDADRYRN
jgi:hypothetical protein